MKGEINMENNMEKTKFEIFLEGLSKGAGFMTGMCIAAVCISIMTGGGKAAG